VYVFEGESLQVLLPFRACDSEVRSDRDVLHRCAR
jgi:hypothetical protein